MPLKTYYICKNKLITKNIIMNKLNHIIYLGIALLLSINIFSSELSEKLLKLPGVISIEELKTSSLFSEKYLVWFEQALDLDNPNAGTFKQRVFVNHKSFDAPVVYTTEGYSGDYAANQRYVNELCKILNANEVLVEHRYFSESVPTPLDWSFLTTKNAAGDHHIIFTALKTIYTSKWVSTGISKGGETCLLYRMYYPEDVDVTVAYVAPVAKALEDGRHEPFIAQVATKSDRKKVSDFQTEILKRRATIFPIFKNYVETSNLTFRIPLEEVYDYCVLEFSFAFWQMFGNTERITGKKESDDKLFKYLIAVSGPSYFSIEGTKPTFPFNYQAARELGYYGYDTKAFEKLLVIKSAKGYFKKVFIPEDMDIQFESQTSINLENFLQTSAKNTFLIYGEYDPWTAVAPSIGENKNVIKVMCPKGTHATRILTLPKDMNEMLVNELNKLMK